MSASWSIERERLRNAMSQPVREHWVLFLIEGIVLLFLGVLAVVIPPLATLTFTVFLGCLFFGQRSRRASHDIRRAGRTRILVVTGRGGAGHCRWSPHAAVAGERSHLPDAAFGGFLHPRWRGIDHVRAGASAAAPGSMGMAACRRLDRPCIGRPPHWWISREG